MTEMKLTEDALAIQQSAYALGEALLATPRARGGLKEWFDNTRDLDAHGLSEEEKRHRLVATAIVLHNARQWLQNMNEATRAVQVGGYLDYILPVIRAGFPNQVAHDLVSVQPMTRPTGQVFFLNYVVGQEKGTFAKGQRIFDARRGFSGSRTYTDEIITGEDQGVSAASATQSGALSYIPIRRNTVQITITAAVPANTVVMTDNGNGGLVLVTGPAGVTIVSSSVNYETGAWTVTLSAPIAGADPMAVDYEYDSEMAPTLPMIDVQITATSLTAKRRAIRSRYSLDAEMDYSAEFGGNLRETIARGVVEILVAEQSREIIHDLWSLAGASVTTFPIAVPVGGSYSQTEHSRDIVYRLNILSNTIWQATQRVHGNWIIVDANAANFIGLIPRPQFEPAPVDNNVLGVQFIGTLAGRFRVYKDPHLQNETGAVAPGNVLMGFKGPNYWDAGYIWAPYQTFQTEPIVLDDFISRQGFAHRYAKKTVNPALYVRLDLT